MSVVYTSLKQEENNCELFNTIDPINIGEYWMTKLNTYFYYTHFCICSHTQAYHLMCIAVWSQEIVCLLCNRAKAWVAEDISLYHSF